MAAFSDDSDKYSYREFLDSETPPASASMLTAAGTTGLSNLPRPRLDSRETGALPNSTADERDR